MCSSDLGVGTRIRSLEFEVETLLLALEEGGSHADRALAVVKAPRNGVAGPGARLQTTMGVPARRCQGEQSGHVLGNSTDEVAPGLRKSVIPFGVVQQVASVRSPDAEVDVRAAADGVDEGLGSE